MASSHPAGPSASAHSPAIRQAGREALSLALMDSRNYTLHLLARIEAACSTPELQDAMAHAVWLAGHAGWFAEAWIGRNTQRSQGPACPARPTRLASFEPHADRWWGEGSAPAALGEAPDAAAARAYLLDQLESTIDLLDKAQPDDTGLYFYRLAVLHEDLRGEDMLAWAQSHGVPLAVPALPVQRPGAPLVLPATRWTLGRPAGGFAFDLEQGALQVDLPEFEIDAQPVSWAQFVEFVDDGGYDQRTFWHAEGWEWLQAMARGEGRRGPRYVDQIGVASGAVLQQRFGRAVRLAAHHGVMHMSWWEADAWCRWAGRRLPSEAEWECAALTAGRRGFDWGQVHEWMSGSLRPWAGYTPGPWASYSQPLMGQARMQRGASFATRGRLRDPRFRGFALPSDDLRFVGFRSCAL